MTFIPQNHTADNEIKRSSASKYEKRELPDFDEIVELRFQLNKAKSDTVTLISKHNEELQANESQLVKLRCEVERGEVVRQSLEYDLALARKQCNVERMALEEEKANTIRIQDLFKAQMEELQRKMHSLQEHFQTTEFNWQTAQKSLENKLQNQYQLSESYKKEQEMLTSENNKLEAVIQKQSAMIQELEQKLRELDLEKNAHIDTVRRHKSELGFTLVREERLKKELETVSERAKRLDENIEAERAAHLESKHNCEIIQLRIRDLEADLQVEKASQAQMSSELELIKNQFKEMEIAYNREKCTTNELTEKLQKLGKESTIVVNDFKEELEKKTQLIADLSEKLSNCEESVAMMEKNLAMTKKKQISFEESYGYIIKELQGLVDSFNVSGLRVSGTSVDNMKPAGPDVLQALRRTLTDYQNKLENTSNELETTKHVCEGLTNDLESSKHIIQSLYKNLENVQTEQKIAEKELQHLNALCAEHKSEIARLQIELGKAQSTWEKEARRALEAESDIQKITKAFQKDTEEKLTFLHSLFQRLVAGCVLIRQPEYMLDNFSWAELCAVLQENVDVMITDLSKANEKVAYLEQVCKNKDDVVMDLQRTHENSLDNLAEQIKSQQSAWQRKTKDMEEQYSALLAEIHAKAQKYQKIAEKLKDKNSVCEKTKDQMALENVHVKNLLISTEKEHKSLLAALALMAGALCPLYNRNCTLAAQRNLLQEQLNSYVDIQNEIRNLVQALSDNDASERKSEHSRSMIWVFRKAVITVLAAKRLQNLGRSNRLLFTWTDRANKRPGVLVCIGQSLSQHKTGVQDDLENCSDAAKWLTSPNLLSTVVNSMTALAQLLNKDLNSRSRVEIIDAAKNSFAKLMDKLNLEMGYTPVDSERASIYIDPDSLAHRLARGIRKLNFSSLNKDLTNAPAKECLASLRKQILGFTQRLCTAEVERRSLRRELSDMKQTFGEIHKNADNLQRLKEQAQTSVQLVPYEKLKAVFEELNKALNREQEAQMLLQEQSQQLLDLNYKIELHSKEEAEKDQTLSEAIKSLSDAKKELWRKDQSLRQQNLQMIQLEQDRHRLEKSIASAEGALRVAARDREILINHMKSVSDTFQKIRDETSLSRSFSTRHDDPIPLPKLSPKMFEMEGYKEQAEFTVCQIMIGHFLDVYQIACTKATALERKVILNEKHIANLKSELHSACLRENKAFTPPYLYERQFIMEVDHNPSSMNGRLLRWDLELQQYQFNIRHKKCHDHDNANGLSREGEGPTKRTLKLRALPLSLRL
ncbi:coiled-coil domain-containing protein 171 [Gastrophryne carolinensis]